jgi:hypothetical protein
VRQVQPFIGTPMRGTVRQFIEVSAKLYAPIAMRAPFPSDTCPDMPTRMTMPNIAVAYMATSAM